MTLTGKQKDSLMKAVLLLKTALRLKKLRARQHFIRSLSPCETRYIVEFVYNIVKGNIPIDKKLQHKLERKHLNLIRRLISKNTCRTLAAKNRLLGQSGGFLPALAPLIAAIAPFIPHIATGIGIASGIAGTAGGIANVIKTARE
jgi:hypothetical protein